MDESRFHFLEIGRVRRRPVVAAEGAAALVPQTRLRLAETIGSFGTALGQFNTPVGLFIDADANVYVADSRNNRIQKVTLSGDVYGMGGSGMLSLPQGVVVDNTGFIYITELGGHRFRKFGPRGQFVFCMGGPSGSLARFSSPTALCMDAYHHLYIADTDNGRITCYSATGHWRTDYHSPTPGTEFRRPQGVAVDQQGRIYVADTLNHRIVRLAPDGALDIAFGKPGPAPGELAEPRGLAADGDGGLWVADSGNDRVQKFDEDGGLVCCFPERPTPGLDLSTPSAVAVDGQGGIYVSDTMNHRLLRLAAVGDG